MATHEQREAGPAPRQASATRPEHQSAPARAQHALDQPTSPGPRAARHPTTLMGLQQTIGNRAVGRLLTTQDHITSPAALQRQAEPGARSTIQRKWYVLGTFASWEADGSQKTPCPEGYTEVEGERSLYGDGWLPYTGGTQPQQPTQQEPLIKAPRRLDIPKIKQEEKGWCYAATSKMIDQTVAGQSLPLWQYVQQYQIKQGQQAAATMNEQQIRQTYGAVFGVETFLHTQRGGTAIDLTEEIIHESLYLNNSPIVLGLGNHSYVMYGYDPKTKTVFAWDPIAGETEYVLQELAFMFEGGQAEYFYNFAKK